MKRKLQVFLSSTFSDLIEERQAAVAAILKAGHIPAGMELFTAGDKSQMKTIERWIDESDVYMLILGGRYGSIEPTSNISYTELEYDYARAQGKPSFSVVIADEALEAKVKSFGTNFMEKTNPKELAQFRAKVLNNISSFFSDPKDIKLCIHESLSDLVVNPALKGWVAVDEIEDTKVLNEEIRKLREENSILKESLRKAEIVPESVKTQPSKHHDELVKVLGAIDIKIPSKLNEGKDTTVSLLDLARNNRDVLINGVTNKAGMSDTFQFYYFNIFPKLQAYGLADNEKVPGVQYRRSFLNRTGQKFFAEIEKRTILAKTEVIANGTEQHSAAKKALHIKKPRAKKPEVG
jgi:Domain of unknown function (DUF4062)